MGTGPSNSRPAQPSTQTPASKGGTHTELGLVAPGVVHQRSSVLGQSVAVDLLC